MIYGRMQKSDDKDIDEGKINSQEYVDFQVGWGQSRRPSWRLGFKGYGKVQRGEDLLRKRKAPLTRIPV